jgi:putative heme transporter
MTPERPGSAPAPPRVPRSLDRLAGVAWRFLVVVAALLAVGYLLVRLRLVVLPVIIALLIASVLAPPAAWLKRKGWRPGLAAATVFVAALLVLGGIVTVLVPVIAGELGDLGESVRQGIRQVESWLTDGPIDLTEGQISDAVDQGAQQAREHADRIIGGALTGAVMAIEIIAGILLTAVILFFFLKDGDMIGRWLVDRAPSDRRGLLTDAGKRAWGTLQAYIGGTAIVGVVDAVLIGIGLFILGVPLVAPLMLLFFFAPFFPYVGAIVVGILAVLVALVTEGAVAALIAAGIVLGIQQLESNLLEPVVLGRAVHLHPLVVLLALTGGAILGGITGAFLAVPIAGVAAAVGNELRVRGETSEG